MSPPVNFPSLSRYGLIFAAAPDWSGDYFCTPLYGRRGLHKEVNLQCVGGKQLR